jgi:hypothetical protein
MVSFIFDIFGHQIYKFNSIMSSNNITKDLEGLMEIMYRLVKEGILPVLQMKKKKKDCANYFNLACKNRFVTFLHVIYVIYRHLQL